MKHHSQTAIIMFGLPASGKSTFIQSEFANVKHTIISADEIKKEFPGYTDANHAEFYKQAVEKAEQLVYEAADRKEDIIFDTGSINTNYSKRIISNLKTRGIEVGLVIVSTPVDVCIERDKNRPQSVGEAVIRAKNEKAPQCLWDLISMVDHTFLAKSVQSLKVGH
jgi:predicted kinase